MADCIFCGIVAKEQPADLVHEDELVVAFPDINPSAPIHLLVVPKQHVPDLESLANAELAQHILQVARRLGEEHSQAGYRVAVNSSKLADVEHLHFHVLGGQTKQEIFEGGERL